MKAQFFLGQFDTQCDVEREQIAFEQRHSWISELYLPLSCSRCQQYPMGRSVRSVERTLQATAVCLTQLWAADEEHALGGLADSNSWSRASYFMSLSFICLTYEWTYFAGLLWRLEKCEGFGIYFATIIGGDNCDFPS